MQREVIIKQLRKKISKLIELESQLSNEINHHDNRVNVNRRIFAGVDGFAILRTFSTIHKKDIEISIFSERISKIVQRQISVHTSLGEHNLYEIIKRAINQELRVGLPIDIGSQTEGVTYFGNLKMDGFQIIIRDYQYMQEAEDVIEDMLFSHQAYVNAQEFERLEQENIQLRKAVSQLSQNKQPLIIAEGKTDWKYILSALRYYHSIGEFTQIDQNWFLRFGTDQDIRDKVCETHFLLFNGSERLSKILTAFTEVRLLEPQSKHPIRIGIFDSDKDIKLVNDEKSNVFSFKIQPNGISIEFLFHKQEITTLIDGRRLYFGTEFEEGTGILLEDRDVVIDKNSSSFRKAGKNHIIDSGIFRSKSESLALSKETFARAVFDERIEISLESWSAFRHIFEEIIRIMHYR